MKKSTLDYIRSFLSEHVSQEVVQELSGKLQKVDETEEVINMFINQKTGRLDLIEFDDFEYVRYAKTRKEESYIFYKDGQSYVLGEELDIPIPSLLLGRFVQIEKFIFANLFKIRCYNSDLLRIYFTPEETEDLTRYLHVSGTAMKQIIIKHRGKHLDTYIDKNISYAPMMSKK